MEPLLVCQTRGTSRWFRIVAGVIIAGVIIAGVLMLSKRRIAGLLALPEGRQATTECEGAVRAGDWRRGVEICLASHEQTGDEAALGWAAQAEISVGDFKRAEEHARQLLRGSLRAYAEGHRFLSFVTLRHGDGQLARDHATIAFLAHSQVGDDRRLTSDALALSQAELSVGDFVAALDAADDALSRARRYHDLPNEFTAHVARGDALRRIGDIYGAKEAFEEALACATRPSDHVWLCLSRAML